MDYINKSRVCERLDASTFAYLEPEISYLIDCSSLLKREVPSSFVFFQILLFIKIKIILCSYMACQNNHFIRWSSAGRSD